MTTITINGKNFPNNDKISVLKGYKIFADYSETGIQNEFIFMNDPIGGTLRVIGGVDDEFTIETKITSEWETRITSNGGKVSDLSIITKGQGIRVNIGTNTSGSIKLELIT